MLLGSSNPMHRLVAGMLVACMAMCCCQWHVIVHQLGAGNDGAGVVVTRSCCETAPAKPAHAPSAPSRNDDSSCHCLKGSGLEQSRVDLPAAVAVADFTPAPPVALLPIDAFAAAAPVRAWRAIRPAPPTLLRQRCALLI